ncbi:hypothetical protein FisN_19Hh147 [Fistulifera solaris]|uniref:Uncharacterized protein n=1 Tax=Fistulifera solaris TaxID=1519565 RepID=A0A1Z5K078_FISSO|nr:hypothetical protein FisN_19Hh147 [Fistulifera solaris]|eukprot:GAX19569.1 hypothetical protein FisN_19Hh147 [Fistulifera solaris]
MTDYSSPFAMALNDPKKDDSAYYDNNNVPLATAIEPHTQPFLAGFELWSPPPPPTYSDGLPVYELLGTDAPFVQIPLRPGRQVMCFAGAMAYMSNDVKMKVEFGGFGKTFGRLAGGGSLFQATYTNESTTHDGYIALTPDYPGVIVPIHMPSCPSGKIIAMRDSFLGSTVPIGELVTDVGAGFNPAESIAGVCCSGVDLIVQTLSHGEWAFLMAMGTVLQKNLAAGEKILVDTDSILCFESSVTMDVQFIGSGMACCCAGEGIFNTTMTGPGKIWIQSLSIDKMRKLFPPKVIQQDSNNSGNVDGPTDA